MRLTDDEIRRVRDRAGEWGHMPEVQWVQSPRNMGMLVSPDFLNRALTELLDMRDFEDAVNSAAKRVRGEP